MKKYQKRIGALCAVMILMLTGCQIQPDRGTETGSSSLKEEKKTESTEGDKEGKKESRYLRREFSYSKFQQTLILPDDVDKDKIDAKVNDGVLTIELPKRTPEDKEKAAKVIEVK